MKTVFLFIPNYVYSSDFLRTRFIHELSNRFKVVVFLPPGIKNEGEPYPQIRNVEYLERALEHPKFWILLGKFLRFSLIRKFDFEPVVERTRARGSGDWRRAILRAIAHIFPKNMISPDLFTWLEVKFLPKSLLLGRLIDIYNPAIILTPTPGFTHYDAEAIIYAKQFHIPTAAINFSWDNLHNGGVHFRRPDFLIVWNERIRQIAVKEYHYRPERVKVSGVMRFDHYFVEEASELSRDAFLKSKNLNPAEKTILLTTVTKGNYEEEHLLLRDLLDAREADKFSGKPNIFVRMHPKEETKKFQQFQGQNISNFHIESAGSSRKVELGSNIELTESDLKNMKYTLKYCDVVVNYASTITLEAFCFDKPVININYPIRYRHVYRFRHYKPIVDAHAVSLADNFDKLIAKIKTSLAHPEYGRTERRNIRDVFVPFGDGRSAGRVADLIADLVYI
jgi:hypothetical protein